MEWTQATSDRIKHLLPVQRGNVKIDNPTFHRALQYMTENGCRWRALPKEFGKWSTIYRRFRYWLDLGVFDRIEKELQSQILKKKKKEITELALDSTLY